MLVLIEGPLFVKVLGGITRAHRTPAESGQHCLVNIERGLWTCLRAAAEALACAYVVAHAAKLPPRAQQLW